MPITIHHLPPMDVSAGTNQGFWFAPLTLIGPFMEFCSFVNVAEDVAPLFYSLSVFLIIGLTVFLKR